MTKYLGIDYGSKKIGLASSDDNGKMAFPYGIIENNKNIVNEILEICDKENIDEIVLGESLNYDGEDNLIMKEIEMLRAKLLTKKLVYYEQEFLTSKQSKNHLINKSARTTKAKTNLLSKEIVKRIDDSAATIILQSYLDKKNEKNN